MVHHVRRRTDGFSTRTNLISVSHAWRISKKEFMSQSQTRQLGSHLPLVCKLQLHIRGPSDPRSGKHSHQKAVFVGFTSVSGGSRAMAESRPDLPMSGIMAIDDAVDAHLFDSPMSTWTCSSGSSESETQ
jgi:hypothetical protein